MRKIAHVVLRYGVQPLAVIITATATLLASDRFSIYFGVICLALLALIYFAISCIWRATVYMTDQLVDDLQEAHSVTSEYGMRTSRIITDLSSEMRLYDSELAEQAMGELHDAYSLYSERHPQ